MAATKKNLLTRFLIWRLKHISHRQFVYVVSIVVGLMSGLGAVILKNLDSLLIQLLLEGKLIKEYQTAFYFIFPVIGFTIVYLFIQFVIRNKASHGIPSTLFAISKRKGIIKRFQMFGSIIAAPITVGFGGSVGLEGPTVATGAALAPTYLDYFI